MCVLANVAHVADSVNSVWGGGGHGLLRELSPGPLAPEARIMPLDQAANEQRPVNRTYTNTVYKVASGSLVVHASGLLAVLFFRFFLAPIAAWCPDCGPEV